MSATYRVLLDGVSSDRDPDEVAAHLARIFNAPPDTVRGLLASRGVVIQEGLDRESAMRVKATLARAGCIAVVTREIAVPVTEPAAAGLPAEDRPSGSSATYYVIPLGIALLIAGVLAIAIAR